MAVRSKAISKTTRRNYNSKGKVSSLTFGKRGHSKTKITFKNGHAKISIVRPKKR